MLRRVQSASDLQAARDHSMMDLPVHRRRRSLNLADRKRSLCDAKPAIAETDRAGGIFSAGPVPSLAI